MIYTIHNGKVCTVKKFWYNNLDKAGYIRLDGDEGDHIPLEVYDQYEYKKYPLYFAPCGLDDSGKLNAIGLFEKAYGDTEQETATWALEFSVVVRMVLAGYFPLNLRYLSLDEIWGNMPQVCLG